MYHSLFHIFSINRFTFLSGGNGSAGLSASTLTESILETTSNILQMTHTASSSSLSSLALDAPVEGTELGSRVAALGARLLLLVVGTGAATLAEGVGLGMAFTKTGGSLSL